MRRSGRHFSSTKPDTFLVDKVGRFIGAGLGAGDAVVVLATRPNRDGFEERLRAHGVDVATALVHTIAGLAEAPKR